MPRTDMGWLVSLAISAKDRTDSNQQSGSRPAEQSLKKGTSLLCRKRDISTLH
jgi:hypothetical protein